MASTSKAFEIVCGSVSSLFDTRWHTHNLCVFCLGKEHARDVLCVHCALSSCPSFQGKRGSRLLPAIRYPPLPRHGGDWNRGVHSWIWPMSYRGTAPFRARRPRTRVSCWIVTMRSFWHQQIQRLVLCWVMPRKSRRCLRVRKLRLKPLNPPALHMNEFLEVMDHKNKYFWP